MNVIKMALGGLCVVACASALAAGPEDVQWCLTGNADSKIFQQPARGYCPQVMAGAVVGIWYAPEYASYVMSMDQRGWSRQAARLSCNRIDSQGQMAAVGLIAACQCHNANSADWVLANPDTVLQMLREYAGC